MKHLFIINPAAGGHRGRIDGLLNEIKTFAETLQDSYEIYLTKAQADAVRKIKEEADKLAHTDTAELYVYACGGDGTLNECINGAAGRGNTAVTHYPCGTGNDFIKTFYPDGPGMFKNLAALSKGTVKQLDIVECVYSGGASGNGSQYGISICSVGIDARIGTDVHKYSRIPIIGGKTGYIVSLIVNVFKGIAQHFRITYSGIITYSLTPAQAGADSANAGEIVIDNDITLACACNGRYYGGGFNPVPDALPDDGILECLVVEPVSRLKVAGIVGKYAKGRFSEFPGLFNYIRCTQVKVEANREFVINIDGEGLYAKEICFKLVPKGVNFFFPENNC